MSISTYTNLKTLFGTFLLRYHITQHGNCVSLSMGEIANTRDLLLRIHSSCLFSETFHATDCDCAIQLRYSLKAICERKCGMLIYLQQEGRGIGLENKIELYRLQNEQELSTDTAYKKLGFKNSDVRDYSLVHQVLKDVWNGDRISILTQNPSKVDALARLGYIVQREPMYYEVHQDSITYLQEMKMKFQHDISFIDEL